MTKKISAREEFVRSIVPSLAIVVVGAIGLATLWMIQEKDANKRDAKEIDAGSYMWVNDYAERCPSIIPKLKHYMQDGMISQREYYALSDMAYKVCTEPRLLKYKEVVQEKVK